MYLKINIHSLKFQVSFFFQFTDIIGSFNELNLQLKRIIA